MSIKNFLLNRTRSFAWLLAAFALVLGMAPVAYAAAGNNNIKIIAWYGAGNLAKSEYGRDTIILFNPTDHSITMNNWSIQIGGTTGAFTSVTYKLPPSVSIPSGGYYAIAGSGVNYNPGGCTSAHCNTTYPFDYQLKTVEGTATDTDNDLSSTGVTVALVDNQTPLGSCPTTSPDLVDLIGIASADGNATTGASGPLVTCWAGSGPARFTPTKLNNIATNINGITYAYATVRKNRCVDTFDNTNDWTLNYIDYKNSSTTPEPCPTGTQLTVDTAVATPNNPTLNTPFLITAHVTPSTNATIQSVVADLSNLGLSSTTQLYDDGTHGDVAAGDGIYSTTAAVTSSTIAANMVIGLNITATDSKGQKATNDIPFTFGGGDYPGPGNNNIRIVAWYGAGNLSGSEYGRDTVILFNPTNHAITMNNWSLQTGSTTGNFGTIYNLPASVTIPSGGYYALAGSGYNPNKSVCTGADCHWNFAYDFNMSTSTCTIATDQNCLSSTQVVVALVNNQTALGNACGKSNPHLVDLIGIQAADGSTTIPCYLGSGPATYTPASINGGATSIHGVKYAYATVRKNRCVNSWDNANDWTLNYIDWKNSASPAEPCTGSGLPSDQLTVVGSGTPNPVGVLETVTLTAKVHPSAGAVVQGVTADLSNIGLSSTSQFFDDGTHGDVTAGDNVYTLKTAPATGQIGIVLGLNATATDSKGNRATAAIPLNILAGSFTITTPTTTATVKAGEVATFVLTYTSVHGYNGTLLNVCTGTPNNGNNPIPSYSQCVLTPPNFQMQPDGTQQATLAIATGTTKTSSTISQTVPMALLGILSSLVLAVAIWRRKHLPLACLLAIACFLSLHTTGCETNAGIGQTSVNTGTYTYVVTATDTNVASVTNSITLTVNVQ